MKFAHQSHLEMLTVLIDNQIDFLVVGGYAVIYHGYVRATGDMDIWLKPTNENKLKLIEVFKKLGFDQDGLNRISEKDFREVVIFHIGNEPERIDFLSKINGVNFDDAFREKQSLMVNGREIPFLHLNDLIASKLVSNRLKDQADVEHLMKVKKSKEKG